MQLRIVSFWLFISFNIGYGQTVQIPFEDDSSKTEIEFEGYISTTDTFKNGNYKKFFEYSNATYEEGSYKENKKHGLFITYFENGKNHWVRSYKDGLLFGNEEFYNSFGELKFTGKYENIKNNIVKYSQFFPNGNLKKTSALKDNKYHSEEITYFENGDTNSVKTFLDGTLNGPFKIKNKSNVITQKGLYNNGVLEGLISTNYEDGSLKSQALFKNGSPNGEMKEYWTNGKLKRVATYKNDTLYGKSITYYEDGTLSSEAIFYKGFFDKEYKEYWENGKIKESINYDKSVKDGESKHFDEVGNLLSKENFSQGIYNGKQLSYYPNGQLKKNFTYRKGHKTGENYSYYENGKLESILVFDENDQITNQKVYHSNEKLKSISTHKYKSTTTPDNKIRISHTTKEKNYYDTEEIESEGNYIDEKKNGEWKYYLSKTSIEEEMKSNDSLRNHIDLYVKKLSKKPLKETINYKADKKHGLVNVFYLNKKTSLEGKYVNNKKTGVWKKYSPNGELISISTYKNNLLHGEYIEYSPSNSEEITKGKYKKGKKEGTWTYLTKNNITKIEKYKKGNLITN